jgi:predicted dehydrogenase
MAEINVGLIGFGMASRVFHAPVITTVSELKLKKIVERQGEESKRRYPFVQIELDVDALLHDEEIDLVVVATPNASHFEFAKRSLLANKHVIVEKPFTLTSNQAEELIDLAKKQNRILTVHQNRRWDGDFLTLQKLLAAQLLGNLVEYEAHYDRFRNHPRGGWKENAEGTGALYDLGSHLIDQALVLFGLPQMITADIRIQRDFSQVVDNFELILHYDNLKVTLKSGMLVREPIPRFILQGTKGSFVKYGLDPQEEALNKGRTPSESNWGVESKEHWGKLNTEIDGLHFDGQIETIAGSYQTFYQNIVDAIRGKAELAVKPEEGRNTIRIIELAMQSNEEKRTLVWQ